MAAGVYCMIGAARCSELMVALCRVFELDARLQRFNTTSGF
jgi:hypothetical protein